MTYRLHHAPDNASLCIRLALMLADLPFEAVLVDRRNAGQRDPAYLALNPNGLIPVLETPEGPIFETAAILLWLADRHPGAGLFPAPQAADRGAALSWLFWMSNTLHPLLRMLFYPSRFIDQDGVPALNAATRINISHQLDRLEDVAAGAPWWLRPGAASAHICYLCPMLRWLAIYPVDGCDWFDLERWPHLAEVAKVTEALPWARAAALAEGLGETFFSSPDYSDPPEGTAT